MGKKQQNCGTREKGLLIRASIVLIRAVEGLSYWSALLSLLFRASIGLLCFFLNDVHTRPLVNKVLPFSVAQCIHHHHHTKYIAVIKVMIRAWAGLDEGKLYSYQRR